MTDGLFVFILSEFQYVLPIKNLWDYHNTGEVGCFYPKALRMQMNVDVTFQNTGGIRTSLNAGDISRREIFEIGPFNNGTVIYEMTVADIKNFLMLSGSGFYSSGCNYTVRATKL